MATANHRTRGSERSNAVSDTPRTDAMDSLRYRSDALFELSRQLERELSAVTAERDALRADLCTFAVDMEKQISASQQETRRLREALDAIMESAKVAYCATTDPMMTDALVGIGKRCKDAIDAELAKEGK